MNSIRFACELVDGVVRVTPCVDGVRLTDMVSAFERERGFAPAGAYGGFVPAYYDYGPLDLYLLGRAPEWNGQVHLLVCECGEWGCWSLRADVVDDGEVVEWRGFAQPHADAWDYAGFGPFKFSRPEYVRAIAAVTRFRDPR